METNEKIYLMMESEPYLQDDYYNDTSVIKAYLNPVVAKAAAEKGNAEKYGDVNGGRYRNYFIGYYVVEVPLVKK